VARGTFSIDGSTFASTIDKVKIGDHFYSHQPPAHAVLTSVLYYPLYWSGLHFSTGRNAAYAVLTFLTNGLSTLLALVLFFQALEWFGLNYLARLWTTVAVACASLLLPYSTTFNVHGLVAAWLFTGLYCFLRAQRASGEKRWLLLSGLAFAACAAMDHGTVFLYAAFLALLILRGERRAAAWFLLPASITLLPTAIYYYWLGGSLLPFAARPELFAYPGSAWVGTGNEAREHLTGEGWNSPAFAIRYGFLCLFGPRGFLVYNPLIWLAIYGLVRTLHRRLLFWQEALAITCGSAAMMLYFFFASTNFGGWSYSVRWFVALLLLWAFFVAPAVEWIAARKWLAAPLLALAAVSLFYSLGGVADPWPRPNSMGYLSPLYSINRMREPVPGITLTFSPDSGQLTPDGASTVEFLLTNTTSQPVTLTRFRLGGVDRSSSIRNLFGGNHMPANSRVLARLRFSGYTAPSDLTVEVDGEEDNGIPVFSKSMVNIHR